MAQQWCHRCGSRSSTDGFRSNRGSLPRCLGARVRHRLVQFHRSRELAQHWCHRGDAAAGSESVAHAFLSPPPCLVRALSTQVTEDGRKFRRVAVRDRSTHSGSRTPQIPETEVPNSPTGRREDSESVRRFRPHPQRDRATFCRKLISIDREKA